MTMQHFLFSQIDSWFFRESRSMDGSGATALESVFPPANNTLLGAIRTQVGNIYHQKHATNWRDFKQNKNLQNIIGFGTDYANLKAQGAWLYHVAEQQIYLPCPLNLLKQGEDDFGCFQLKKSCHCDIGRNVLLPELDYEHAQTPIESAYISSSDFGKLLNGQKPNKIIEQQDILLSDARLGIECDSVRHKTVDGKLYQTKHLRLKDQWNLYFAVAGMDADYPIPDDLLRLGGEGRMAHVQTLTTAPALPAPPKLNPQAKYLMLYLLTPLPVHASNNALPNASFQLQEDETVSYWRGVINETEVDVVSAIIGKAERRGGWDLANNQSLPVKSFIPAGSCWFIKNNQNAAQIIANLHHQFLTTANERAQGFGQMAIGVCPSFN